MLTEVHEITPWCQRECLGELLFCLWETHTQRGSFSVGAALVLSDQAAHFCLIFSHLAFFAFAFSPFLLCSDLRILLLCGLCEFIHRNMWPFDEPKGHACTAPVPRPLGWITHVSLKHCFFMGNNAQTDKQL